MKGYLLINLGTPDDLSVRSVRKYLREFLMDEYVIDINPVSRFFLVHGIIAPFRAPKSLNAYRKIWTAQGSPLLVNGVNLCRKLAAKLEAPLALAMRYGKPSIESVLTRLHEDGVTELVVLPLYPQYAESSTLSSMQKVKSVLDQKGWGMQVRFIRHFYQHPSFVEAWAQKIRVQLQSMYYDHVLFTYHGLPEHHLQKLDATSSHCLKRPDCCAQIGAVNESCYRAHCFATTDLIARQFDWPHSFYTTAFQSRLGRREWIKPYTDFVLKDLASGGIRKLLVISPSFVADCLETLEEIGLRGRDDFIRAGGQSLDLLPSLNDDALWVDAVTEILANPSSFSY